ncbi:TetR/AcrR family transcriptional regulator [Actinomadura verrucosospora]|uniref:TetR family transcriptional regulator n=1 Tax=Actinomadura verrucosospora TaxID=46165 RepID=A0A7D4ABK0_ACTVE|nr:TetR/AcrR family transcriptional regulator [Actinomadura verrucosospora]QKG27065.1 TetR family transcriptional regulator [Actinomadura verrucosospora]
MEDEEQIIALATRLFAELGYDSTGVDLIADAAGDGGQALIAAAGGKSGLYRRVMDRAYRAEQDMLDAALAAYTPDPAGTHRVIDDYLDFYVANPEIIALWMHRWMGDAADVGELERDFVDPQDELVTGVVAGEVPPDVAVDLLVRTVVWCVFGFLSGGVRGGRGRTEPRSPEAIERFRDYLHVLVDRMMTPAP